LKICRKFSRNGVYRSKPKKDYDLDYWLDYVDISSNSDIFQASDYRQTPNEISTTSFVKFKKFLKHPFRRKLAETNHRRVRRSIFYKDLEANAQLIDNYYKDILQNVPSHFDGFRVKRRSHSWPKCNKDFLKMHSLHLEKINQ